MLRSRNEHHYFKIYTFVALGHFQMWLQSLLYFRVQQTSTAVSLDSTGIAQLSTGHPRSKKHSSPAASNRNTPTGRTKSVLSDVHKLHFTPEKD